ncbi:hypothetical protein D3C85_1840990 [compost metagenome]
MTQCNIGRAAFEVDQFVGRLNADFYVGEFAIEIGQLGDQPGGSECGGGIDRHLVLVLHCTQ